eukprot:CFRG7308T1
MSGETEVARVDPMIPSAVLHLRNVPLEAVDTELLILAQKFGIVKNLFRLPGKTQAFVEMNSIQSATAMLNHYKEVQATVGQNMIYLQYSQHQHLQIQQPTDVITDESGPSDGSILLVKLLQMVYPVTLETLCQVICKYGHILKIVSFTSDGIWQCLVQLANAQEATKTMAALQGQFIYHQCNQLEIEISPVRSLQVKYNNTRSWDFTNPSLPIGSEFGFQSHHTHGYDGMWLGGIRVGPTQPCVLHVRNLNHKLVTPDILFTLFGVYSDVQRVKILYKQPESALIQIKENMQGYLAMIHLNGVPLFGKDLHIMQSKHTEVRLFGPSHPSRNHSIHKNIAAQSQASIQASHDTSTNLNVNESHVLAHGKHKSQAQHQTHHQHQRYNAHNQKNNRGDTHTKKVMSSEVNSTIANIIAGEKIDSIVSNQHRQQHSHKQNERSSLSPQSSTMSSTATILSQDIHERASLDGVNLSENDLESDSSAKPKPDGVIDMICAGVQAVKVHESDQNVTCMATGTDVPAQLQNCNSPDPIPILSTDPNASISVSESKAEKDCVCETNGTKLNTHICPSNMLTQHVSDCHIQSSPVLFEANSNEMDSMQHKATTSSSAIPPPREQVPTSMDSSGVNVNVRDVDSKEPQEGSKGNSMAKSKSSKRSKDDIVPRDTTKQSKKDVNAYDQKDIIRQATEPSAVAPVDVTSDILKANTHTFPSATTSTHNKRKGRGGQGHGHNFNENALSRDYTNSPLHRFRIAGSKNYGNIAPPSPTLHLSNIPSDTSEVDLTELCSRFGTVLGLRFFPTQRDAERIRLMALVAYASKGQAVDALVRLHNYQIHENMHLRVSFSKTAY